MTAIKIKTRADKSQSDFESLRRIMDDMKEYKVSTSNREEAVRFRQEEFEERLREAGVSR